ncbi:hypothetical protein LCGC14_2115060 [marine sediment metagenome]|uniref:Uncharacterized protein n=1 Tax=marine sediment metagenome TaxID=412755 RepID=A0A0F9ET26_9ZZZZ
MNSRKFFKSMAATCVGLLGVGTAKVLAEKQAADKQAAIHATLSDPASASVHVVRQQRYVDSGGEQSLNIRDKYTMEDDPKIYVVTNAIVS